MTKPEIRSMTDEERRASLQRAQANHKQEEQTDGNEKEKR